jgi:hypothetical protein
VNRIIELVERRLYLSPSHYHIHTMASTRLQDDLLREFREQKRVIQAQIDDFNPLAMSLRKPAAQRLAGKGLILFGELLCWGLFLGAIAMCVFLNRLIPFYLLFQLKRPQHVESLGLQNVQMLQWGVYGLVGLSGLALLLLARALRKIRLKNDILQMTGSRIKGLIGQQLQRKAAFDTIEQRHFSELPMEMPKNVNAIPNPAYDEYEGVVQAPL